MNMRPRHRVQAILALCMTLILCIPTYTGYAANINDLENKTSDLKSELNDLNKELSSLSSELDSLMAQIETVSAEVETAKTELADAEQKEKEQYEAMKLRIKYMYEEGNLSFLEILFTSSSMADFLNNADFIAAITEYDRQLLDELIATQDEVEARKEALEEQEASLISLKEQLVSKQSSLESRISSTSGELATYSEQLARAKAAAQEAQNALDKEGQPSGGSGSSSSGGTSTEKPSNSGGSQNVTDSVVTKMAALLQCEAGTNYDNCLAVGTVIMNRVNSSRYPNSISGVMYQSGQFPPVKGTKFKNLVKNGPNSNCIKAAKDSINGKVHPKVANCYSFRAAGSTSHKGVIVGDNVFF